MNERLCLLKKTKERVLTSAVKFEIGRDMNVHHIQAHVPRLPSYVNEHVSPQVWFGLHQDPFSRGSPHPLLFTANQDPTTYLIFICWQAESGACFTSLFPDWDTHQSKSSSLRSRSLLSASCPYPAGPCSTLGTNQWPFSLSFSFSYVDPQAFSI
jgi:hypothetical protein